jgi:hypothetical protein
MNKIIFILAKLRKCLSFDGLTDNQFELNERKNYTR